MEDLMFNIRKEITVIRDEIFKIFYTAVMCNLLLKFMHLFFLRKCECPPGTSGITTNIPDSVWLPISGYRTNRMVTIDPCIYRVIKYLWKHGVATMGCCCGHNKDLPCIIVDEQYSLTELYIISMLIREIDSRDWIIEQWTNNIVSKKSVNKLQKFTRRELYELLDPENADRIIRYNKDARKQWI